MQIISYYFRPDLSTLPKLEEINLSANGLRYLNISLLKSKTLAKIYLGSNYIFKIKFPSASPANSFASPVPPGRQGTSRVSEIKDQGNPLPSTFYVSFV